MIATLAKTDVDDLLVEPLLYRLNGGHEIRIVGQEDTNVEGIINRTREKIRDN